VIRQLPLPLKLRDASSFENFLAGDNAELLARVRRLVEPGAGFACLLLWGEAAAGKTHLLEAACRAAHAAGGAVQYVPLAERAGLDPALLDGIERAALVCVDDLHAAAGDRVWEEALLGVYERARAHGGALLLASRLPPAGLDALLPDLLTRLRAGLVYPLKSLDDAGKIAALRLRARNRGLDLPEDVARYVLSRYPRDLHALFALLDRIDDASLAAQRRITIPFLRELEKINNPL